MRIQYIEKKFRKSSLDIIDQANEIIDEYTKQGFDLTLRQLYYQFVARDILDNRQREYNRLGSIVNDARLAGLISWLAIEDRTRFLRGTNHQESPAEAVKSAAERYRIDKWAPQKNRVEVWIEKDALIGVIEGVCDKLDIDYFSCRGYVSQSEMWRAARRMRRYIGSGQHPVIIHLGDHDPSGIDMTRDIFDRNQVFGADFKVKRIALNFDQVEEYCPPPNPAKMTDSRFDGYCRKYGDESWELDALEPSVLAELVESSVLEYRDETKWGESVEEEAEHIRALEEVAENI